jgi:hypothetical protein
MCTAFLRELHCVPLSGVLQQHLAVMLQPGKLQTRLHLAQSFAPLHNHPLVCIVLSGQSSPTG